jgi:hypothetical protein
MVIDSGRMDQAFGHGNETSDRLRSKLEDVLKFGMTSTSVGRDLADMEKDQHMG